MAKVLYIWDYKCGNFHCLILIFWFLKNSWPLKFGFWPFPATLTFSAKNFEIWSFHVISRKPLHVRTWFAQKKHTSLHPTACGYRKTVLLSCWSLEDSATLLLKGICMICRFAWRKRLQALLEASSAGPLEFSGRRLVGSWYSVHNK